MTTSTKSEAEIGARTARAGGLKPADNVRNFFCIEVAPETTQADLERPGFWMHIADKLRQFDRIEVRWQNGEKWADLLICSSGPGFARVHVLSFMGFANKTKVDEEAAAIGAAAATATGDDDGLVHCYVKFRGPTCRWSVLRRSDHLLIEERIDDKIDALVKARQYDQTVSG